MSMRSIVIVAAVIAVIIFAQNSASWTDTFLSFHVNATNSTVKLCAVDRPTTCVFVPKLSKINITLALEDYNKTWLFLVASNRILNYYPPDYELLQYVVHSFSNTPPLTIQVPISGVLYSSSSFHVDGRSAQTGYPSICGRTLSYAYSVSPGAYSITNLRSALYLLDPNTCLVYRLVDSISRAANMTGRIYLYLFYMPTAHRKYIRTTAVGGYDIYAFNATQHAYFIHIYTLALLRPLVGRGAYLANGTWLPTVVLSTYYDSAIMQLFSYGPVHYSTYRNSTVTLSPFALLTIGQTPGDGVVNIRFPVRGKTHVAYVADGTTGYVDLPSALPRSLLIYVMRYSLVEVYVANATHSYTARIMACTAYFGEDNFAFSSPVMYVPTNRIYEVEICNNMTSTYYAGVYVYYSPTAYGYTYIDELKPGTCRRLRWDAFYGNQHVTFRFFNSTRNVCRLRQEFSVAGTKCPAGWRCFLSNRDLVAAHPIDPDALYAAMWQEFVKYLAQQYNATMTALTQWLQMQANATRSMQNFIASQPRVIGTIQMGSSTSMWLRTVLSEIQKVQIPGASGNIPYAGISTPPLAVAPAAAAAVAVAWAASRRDDDVVTTAAIAGIALALFGMLMTLIYGSESLPLVALGIIIAAAAAAWRKL